MVLSQTRPNTPAVTFITAKKFLFSWPPPLHPAKEQAVRRWYSPGQGLPSVRACMCAGSLKLLYQSTTNWLASTPEISCSAVLEAGALRPGCQQGCSSWGLWEPLCSLPVPWLLAVCWRSLVCFARGSKPSSPPPSPHCALSCEYVCRFPPLIRTSVILY